MVIKHAASAGLLVMLAGCSGLAERISGNVTQADAKVSPLVSDVGRTAPGVIGKSSPNVVRESGIWLGKNVVKVGQPTLPPIFYEPATFDRSVNSLSELAERITLRAGIPTKVTPDAQNISSGAAQASAAAPAGGAGPSVAATAPLPTGSPLGATRQGGPVRITYANGNFKGLLDTAAARFGVYWKYVDGTIQFFHTDSRTFQINAIPGDSTFTANVNSGATSTGGVTGGAGGTGGGGGGGSNGVTASNSQNTNVTSRLSVYTGIEKAVTAMLSSYGKVVASPATGSMTVVDTPDTLDRIASFIENENKALSRQVVINVTVLSVNLSDTDEYGINWDLVYSTLNNKYGIKNVVARDPRSVGFSAGVLATSTSRLAGSSVVIDALSQQGKVRRQTTASVVTLNNQPVPVQVAKQTSYLASSQTTITALVGATTTLTPGTVTSGFNMSILPHVLTNGTVMLQFSTDISSLREIRSVESNGSKIETPSLDTRNFLQRVAMKSNETLIISGFEQTDDNLDQQGVGHPKNFVLGGGYKANSSKEVIVILITPTTMSN
ncbi:PilN family type IVB pilus formation outer membrane protein [Noviherbaspirillum cavernae]|uniref:PilN family type IVB pilus formation outer membrane protein n=1 Tax=Noviherbaspirillum cavernae TaxID=2320862 RepID=A0A418WVV3_9BURK|nr:PilN family type IVB pilus formation outer membrane protein [Noviherbaspirillum cavernae]RJF96862.1 PilN family type IVB pilus formation outer membrane protein [Noviherbaspirillum cavernae]